MRGVRRLHEWARHQARVRPEATAVALGEEVLTYGRLDELSDALAALLRETDCRAGDRVALLAPRSPRTVAAALGVYKAGALLVPLDPEGPAARQEKVLRSSGCRLLLADGGAAGARRAEEVLLRPGLPDGLHLGWFGPSRELAEAGLAAVFTGEDADRYRGAPPPGEPAGSGDAAHILFTSGSTGEPKGVVVRHESVIRFVEWAVDHFRIEPGERLSGHSPLHFDLSTFDLFGSLAAGAELHLIPPELNLLPHRLAELIRRSRLTQWFSVPSVLNYMARFDVVEPGDFPALRRLMWCGEVFPTPALVYWMERLPHARFTNLYGPTEATIASSFHDVPRAPEDERAPVPIGRACPGEELLVLDRHLRPVAPGEQGELYLRGVGLSPGYWQDPARTREVFLPDPAGGGPGERIYRTGDLARLGEDGLVYFCGRADSQVKSRGYRVELGEVEIAVASLGLAREAVVTAVPTDGFEGHRICCAYVPAPDRDATPSALRRELRRLLPDYMIPARWLTYERLPRNANGKLDRKRIQEEIQNARHATPGRSGVGTALAAG